MGTANITKTDTIMQEYAYTFTAPNQNAYNGNWLLAFNAVTPGNTGIGVGCGCILDDVSVKEIFQDDVYVRSNGNNVNYGTAASPVQTIYEAYSRVADGGTIHVMDAIQVNTLLNVNKKVTITGVVLCQYLVQNKMRILSSF